MTFTQFLLILRARRKIIILTLLAIVACALAVSLLLPNSYKATTTLVLNYKGTDPVTGLNTPVQFMPGYMATQVDIIRSKSVALRVVDQLKLADNAAIKQDFYERTNGNGDVRDWLAGLLLKKLDAIPSRESSVLDISFTGSNPQFAAAVANAFAAEYQQTTIQLKVDPLKKASGYFNEQIKALRENLESAQSKLSAYQQKKGLVSVDNRLDVESARLNDLSTQLVLVQGQLADALSRQRHAQGSSAGESPDIIANPLIQNLKVALVQAEARFSEISQKLGKNHPHYQGAQAEVDKLRSELTQHIQSTSNSVGNSARILQQRESEVRTALERQKNKVLGLNRARDELMVLVREAESAQHAYDATLQRFNQTSLEGQANQTDVAVLNPAVPPLEPDGPKVFLNVLLSVFLGSLLGIGAAMLAEIFDRRVRSMADIPDVLQAPVLGVMVWAAPKRSRFHMSKTLLSRRLRLN